VPGGFAGVDVFFVISGYLISLIVLTDLDQGTFSFAQFYGRRIRRIFPALLLVIAAIGILGWFTLLPGEFQALGKHIAGSAIFSSNFLLLKESGYFDRQAELKPLLHLWSLAIEEQFYIVWPILFYVSWKKKLNLLWIVLLLACLWWLGGRDPLTAVALIAFLPVAVELPARNIHLVLAVLAVLALRRSPLF
jgi:peptidoglycan/LPS O-acetylase OafA/YrhL